MPVGPEGRDATVCLPERLQSLEHGLRVVKDGCARVEGQRRVREERGAVPATVHGPPDSDHVLCEDAAETRVRQEGLTLGGGDAIRRLVDLERQGGCARTHNPQHYRPLAAGRTSRCRVRRAPPRAYLLGSPPGGSGRGPPATSR